VLHGHEVRLNSADSINALQMTYFEVDTFSSPAKLSNGRSGKGVQDEEFLYTSDPANDEQEEAFSPTDFESSANPSPTF
jgi:hypothetical protein